MSCSTTDVCVGYLTYPVASDPEIGDFVVGKMHVFKTPEDAFAMLIEVYGAPRNDATVEPFSKVLLRGQPVSLFFDGDIQIDIQPLVPQTYEQWRERRMPAKAFFSQNPCGEVRYVQNEFGIRRYRTLSKAEHATLQVGDRVLIDHAHEGQIQQILTIATVTYLHLQHKGVVTSVPIQHTTVIELYESTC